MKLKTELVSIVQMMTTASHILSHLTFQEQVVYLQEGANAEEGTAIAYLIAPPAEAMVALDAALKAADVSVGAFYGPPSETNFAGGLLIGSQSACRAACDAFAQTVQSIADNPKSY